MTAPPKMEAPPGGQPSGAVETPGKGPKRTVAVRSDVAKDCRPARRGRQIRREVYTGRLVLGAAVDVAELRARGKHIVVVDHEGAHVGHKHNPAARLWAQLDDRLLVAPADLDDDRIAFVEVTRIDAATGDPTVHVVCGELAPAGAVHVMRAPRPKSDRRPPVSDLPLGDRLRDLVRRARLEAVS